MMVVVAIIGVIAAIAIPFLLPEVDKARAFGSADAVAAFIARARSEAMLSKRCVRVWVLAPRTLVAERLNTWDCDDDPISLGAMAVRRIDGSNPPTAANAWLRMNVLSLEEPSLSISFEQAPNETRASSLGPGSLVNIPAGFDGNEVRFRPNGRVFSNDAMAAPPGGPLSNLENDDAVIAIAHTRLPAPQRILVNGNGLICVIPRGDPPPGSTPNFDCPQ